MNQNAVVKDGFIIFGDNQRESEKSLNEKNPDILAWTKMPGYKEGYLIMIANMKADIHAQYDQWENLNLIFIRYKDTCQPYRLFWVIPRELGIRLRVIYRLAALQWSYINIAFVKTTPYDIIWRTFSSAWCILRTQAVDIVCRWAKCPHLIKSKI